MAVSDLFDISFADDEEAKKLRDQMGDSTSGVTAQSANTNPLSPASMQQMVQQPGIASPAAQPQTSATNTGIAPTVAGLFRNPLTDLQKDLEERNKKLFSASKVGSMFGTVPTNNFMS